MANEVCEVCHVPHPEGSVHMGLTSVTSPDPVLQQILTAMEAGDPGTEKMRITITNEGIAVEWDD